MILIVQKQVLQTTPVFLAFESIEIYFAATPDKRRIVEWSKALGVLVII